MARQESNQNKRLDRVGRDVLRASVIGDEEAENLAQSPFLFTRIRSRIESERQAEETAGIWNSFWLISRKAIPAMSLVAAISLGLFIYSGNKSSRPTFSVDAYLGTSDSRIENLVFAERQPVTVDEVLATIATRDEREPAR